MLEEREKWMRKKINKSEGLKMAMVLMRKTM